VLCAAALWLLKADFSGLGGLRAYIQTRAGRPRHVSLCKAAPACPELGPFLLGKRKTRRLGRLVQLAVDQAPAETSKFKSPGMKGATDDILRDVVAKRYRLLGSVSV
jgi:hypothetical protein